MYGIILILFIGKCIYEACKTDVPAGSYDNWNAYMKDVDKVRFGEMSQWQLDRNVKNGKYRK